MISRVGCLQTGLFSLPRIGPLELHWPRAPMDSTGRWYVASDVWHPTLFRSGVQCTAHRTTHTHRRPRRRRRRPPSLRLDCRSRRASPVTTPLALAAPAGRCTPRHHSRSSRSLPLATVLWFPSVVDFPPPRHHPLDAALATHRPRPLAAPPSAPSCPLAPPPPPARHCLHRHHSLESVCGRAVTCTPERECVHVGRCSDDMQPARAPRRQRALRFAYVYRTGVQH